MSPLEYKCQTLGLVGISVATPIVNVDEGFHNPWECQHLNRTTELKGQKDAQELKDQRRAKRG